MDERLPKRPIRFALFCSGPVGEAVAAFLAESGDPPDCLVLDAAEDSAARARLVRAAALADAAPVFDSRALTEPATLSTLRSLHLDLAILAWWPYLIREPLLALARLGCINFHNGLLPHNRGKHPNFWALQEERPYGVSLHWVDADVDTGPIAFQVEVPVSWEDTGGTLYERGCAAIVNLFRESWPRIRLADIPRRSQVLAEGSTHRARELESASRLHLDAPTTARSVLNLVRARTFPPHPAVRFADGGAEYEVRVEIRRVSP